MSILIMPTVQFTRYMQIRVWVHTFFHPSCKMDFDIFSIPSYISYPSVIQILIFKNM